MCYTIIRKRKETSQTGKGIKMLKELLGLTVEEVITRLHDAGLSYVIHCAEEWWDDDYIVVDWDADCSGVKLAITDGCIEYYEFLGWI